MKENTALQGPAGLQGAESPGLGMRRGKMIANITQPRAGAGLTSRSRGFPSPPPPALLRARRAPTEGSIPGVLGGRPGRAVLCFPPHSQHQAPGGPCPTPVLHPRLLQSPPAPLPLPDKTRGCTPCLPHLLRWIWSAFPPSSSREAAPCLSHPHAAARPFPQPLFFLFLGDLAAPCPRQACVPG